MSYAADLFAMWRRAASYIDRILKGERPGDLPIEQPTAVSLKINLKTAKALGLAVPASLIVAADEVIDSSQARYDVVLRRSTNFEKWALVETDRRHGFLPRRIPFVSL
jgi:hypothetical protein